MLLTVKMSIWMNISLPLVVDQSPGLADWNRAGFNHWFKPWL